MKRIVLTITLALTSTAVQARSYVTYRVPQVRPPSIPLRLPSSRDRKVQMVQTIGTLGIGAYEVNVADRHGEEAMKIAREDRQLEHQETMARIESQLQRQRSYERPTSYSRPISYERPTSYASYGGNGYSRSYSSSSPSRIVVVPVVNSTPQTPKPVFLPQDMLREKKEEESPQWEKLAQESQAKLKESIEQQKLLLKEVKSLQEEVELIREENKKLREENNQLRQENENLRQQLEKQKEK